MPEQPQEARSAATLLPSECPNCGRLHEGHDFNENPGPIQAEVERLREALRGIATLRGWAQVVREGGEERFGFRALEESEREPVARGFEHAAYLAEEALDVKK